MKKYSLIITALFSILFMSCADPHAGLQELEVNIDSVPTIFKEIADTKKTGSFATFVVYLDDRKDYLNIQYSYENSEPGLDWVLLGAVNKKDKSKFISFAEKEGYEITSQTLNGVKSLRITKGDLVGLCQKVILDMYGHDPNKPFGVVYRWIDLEKYISNNPVQSAAVLRTAAD